MPDADRDAKIEQLLLVGLDHYFAAQYDQAINVWTRALFLDRVEDKSTIHPLSEDEEPEEAAVAAGD